MTDPNTAPHSTRSSRAQSLSAAPRPWKHNPSAWDQRIPICLIAAVAFCISTYLALYQWRLIPTVWDPVFGNQTANVLDSEVSHKMRSWLLVPDAAFGAFAYLGDLVFGLAGSTRRWQYRPWIVLLFGLDVIPLGVVSAVLVGLQGTVVGAWCFLCLVTAVLSLVLAAMAADEVWSCILYLRRVWSETQSKEILWKTFWGQRTPEGDRVASHFLKEAV